MTLRFSLAVLFYLFVGIQVASASAQPADFPFPAGTKLVVVTAGKDKHTSEIAIFPDGKSLALRVFCDSPVPSSITLETLKSYWGPGESGYTSPLSQDGTADFMYWTFQLRSKEDPTLVFNVTPMFYINSKELVEITVYGPHGEFGRIPRSGIPANNWKVGSRSFQGTKLTSSSCKV